ncbi:MAG: HAD-IIB family hydrolase [Mycoplasmoidaceae bacterium]|nr:HAD-IIB family hydrolase [Mycoplasmoidaceae bacterium]
MSFSKKKIAKALDELREKYKDKLIFSFSSKNLIEINSEGIDKGYAINFVLNKTQTKKENSIFFGDSFNDVPAFKQCGCSYAIKPKNKDVKSFATKTIDFKRNAIAKIINNFILEKDDGKEIRLIATDLDGTLLENETKQIIPSTVEKIISAVDDKNTYFAIATGRNIDDVKLIVKNIGIKNLNNCFGILNNGALVYEFKTNEYIYQRQLAESLTQIILNEIKILNSSKKFGDVGCYIHRTIDLKKLNSKQKTELYGYNLKFVKTRLA